MASKIEIIFADSKSADTCREPQSPHFFRLRGPDAGVKPTGRPLRTEGTMASHRQPIALLDKDHLVVVATGFIIDPALNYGGVKPALDRVQVEVTRVCAQGAVVLCKDVNLTMRKSNIGREYDRAGGPTMSDWAYEYIPDVSSSSSSNPEPTPRPFPSGGRLITWRSRAACSSAIRWKRRRTSAASAICTFITFVRQTEMPITSSSTGLALLTTISPATSCTARGATGR